MDCSILLEEVTRFVGNKVKQNFKSEQFDNSVRYLPPGETLDAGTFVACDEVVDNILNVLSNETTSHLLRCGLSDKSYNNVKSILEERFNEDIGLLLPYKLAQSRPPMKTNWLQKQHTHHDAAFESEIDSDEDEVIIDDTTLNETSEVKKKRRKKRKKNEALTKNNNQQMEKEKRLASFQKSNQRRTLVWRKFIR